MAKPTAKATSNTGNNRIVARNRSVRFEYELLELIEAGIVLTGTEVKSLRTGGADLTDSFALIRDSEVWLHGLHIKPYEQGNRANVDPDRKRKLLLSKKQIRYFAEKVARDGFALAVTKVYVNKRGLFKVEIGLAKGKKLHDKRRTIAARQQSREIERDLKLRQRR